MARIQITIPFLFFHIFKFSIFFFCRQRWSDGIATTDDARTQHAKFHISAQVISHFSFRLERFFCSLVVPAKRRLTTTATVDKVHTTEYKHTRDSRYASIARNYYLAFPPPARSSIVLSRIMPYDSHNSHAHGRWVVTTRWNCAGKWKYQTTGKEDDSEWGKQMGYCSNA